MDVTRYPRFLSGRGLIALVLVRGDTTDARNSSLVCESRPVFSDNSFELLSIFFAAFAFLLGLFFPVAIKIILPVFVIPLPLLPTAGAANS